MDTVEQNSEQSRLYEIADKYRAWGYEVVVRPSRHILPSFLGNYQPDIIARNGDQNVLIEVKESASKRDGDHYEAIAREVNNHVGWRFDLIVPNTPEQPVVGSEYPLLSLADIERVVEEAEALLDLGHSVAALLVGWSAAEALLRVLAEEEDVSLQRREPNALLKSLAVRGVISRDLFQSLRERQHARNAAAHGFGVADVEIHARLLFEALRRLVEEAQK